MTIDINGRAIGPGHPPYVIAEISANHNGDIGNAQRLIAAAKGAGADAVKLQTYTPDTITLRSDRPEFRIEGGLWDGRTLHDLYGEAHTPWDWHPRLFQTARDEGITLFSSPFDPTAVDLLASLGAPAYKIASFELVDTPLIRYAAAQGKPLIMSTGMANPTEIAEALEAAKAAPGVALLHCVSGYPAPASSYGLQRIGDMSRRFGVPIGLSDHTLDNATAVAAVAMGACLVEKHFTLDRSGGGPDDSFSLEPSEMARLVQDARTAWEACGPTQYGPGQAEAGNIQFRRSLYFVRNYQVDEIVTADGVRSVRPGNGLAPKHFDAVVGARAVRPILAGTPASWDDIDRTTPQNS
jgi:pseudaminic acid synthase